MLYSCSVFPLSNPMACGSSSITAFRDSTAPVGLPGRFRIKDFPRTPHTPRLSTANGVFFAPSARIRSATPSSKRSHTARVASGVMSHGEIPVPPVVTTRLTSLANRRISSSSAGRSSAMISVARIVKPFCLRTSTTAGPERSVRFPLEHESLTVITAAVSSPEVEEVSLSLCPICFSHSIRPWERAPSSVR
jgi:hypothetical protein